LDAVYANFARTASSSSSPSLKTLRYGVSTGA
jgi:hypothetical protein